MYYLKKKKVEKIMSKDVADYLIEIRDLLIEGCDRDLPYTAIYNAIDLLNELDNAMTLNSSTVEDINYTPNKILDQSTSLGKG